MRTCRRFEKKCFLFHADAQLCSNVIWLVTPYIPWQVYSCRPVDPRICQRRSYGFIFSHSYPNVMTASKINREYNVLLYMHIKAYLKLKNIFSKRIAINKQEIKTVLYFLLEKMINNYCDITNVFLLANVVKNTHKFLLSIYFYCNVKITSSYSYPNILVIFLFKKNRN